MKQIKKFASLLLAMVMVFAMTITAFAAEETGEPSTSNYTITAPDNNHVYEVYQIFTGDLDFETKTLSNVKWGKNGSVAEGEAVDKAIMTELEETKGTDSQELAVIKKYANLGGTAFGKVTNKENQEGISSTLSAPAGYYLIKDVDGAFEEQDDTYTLYIVKIVGDVTIAPKGNKPSSEKKVKDINDTTGAETDWQDSADYDIGDSVKFQLKAILPDNVTSYETYKLVFKDTQSAGLTYNGNAVVKVNGVEVGPITPGIEDYTGEEATYQNGKMLTFTIEDIKAAPYNAGNSAVITIEYTATLNENAKLGSAGNPNKMHIEYSNNPNGEGTGKTPDDVVVVFTYKTVVNKVDSEGKALTGAEFKLEKKLPGENSWKTIMAVKNEAGTNFTFSGLDDGDYRLTETTTPSGYNTIAPIEFTVTADHKVTSDNPVLTNLTGSVTTGEITFTSNLEDGSLSTNVVNQKGTVLPETGGMGTKIFYILGSILVVSAAVLLIARRRMNVEK